MENTRVKVLIADDHKIFVDAVANLLSESGRYEVAGKYHTGTSLLDGFQAIGPDLVILDLEMPGLGGLDVTRRIRLIDSLCKIAVISMHEEVTYSKIAYRHGADGYFSKSIDAPLLVSSLDHIMRGEKLFNYDILEEEKKPALLSDRETAVIRLIATGKTSPEIADLLSISELTVKTHRQNLMRKLDASNTAALIREGFALGVL